MIAFHPDPVLRLVEARIVQATGLHVVPAPIHPVVRVRVYHPAPRGPEVYEAEPVTEWDLPDGTHVEVFANGVTLYTPPERERGQERVPSGLTRPAHLLHPESRRTVGRPLREPLTWRRWLGQRIRRAAEDFVGRITITWELYRDQERRHREPRQSLWVTPRSPAAACATSPPHRPHRHPEVLAGPSGPSWPARAAAAERTRRGPLGCRSAGATP